MRCRQGEREGVGGLSRIVGGPVRDDDDDTVGGQQHGSRGDADNEGGHIMGTMVAHAGNESDVELETLTARNVTTDEDGYGDQGVVE